VSRNAVSFKNTALASHMCDFRRFCTDNSRHILVYPSYVSQRLLNICCCTLENEFFLRVFRNGCGRFGVKTRLLAGLSGVRILVARIFCFFETSSLALRPKQLSIKCTHGFFLQEHSWRSVTLTIYVQPMPRLRRTGAIRLHPHVPLWRGQGKLYFYLKFKY